MAERIISKGIGDIVKPRYKMYAHSVLGDRAIPDLHTGLKPVQTRSLYSMSEMGLKANQKPKKAARVVGDVIGRFHPHGDQSVYDATVRMAQEWNSRYPLVYLQGNNGSRDGDPAAAMRYTEIKLTKIGEQLTADLHKNTVDFKPNYDDTELEPVTFPCMLPMLLANGTEGIAVGLSTSIPPHNIGELLDASIELIDNVLEDKETTIEDLMKHIKGPDFPDGGVIVSKKDLKKAYETGKGRITLRAKVDIETSKKGIPSLIITEFPYQVKPCDFVKKVKVLINDNKIEGIREVIDESSEENGVRVEIVLKKDSNIELVLNQLYKQTDLQKNITFNMNALLHGKPVTVTLTDYMDEYLSHCMNVMIRRTQFDLDKDIKRAKIIEAIATAAENFDTVVQIQKEAEDTIQTLKDTFEFDDDQAKYIDDIKLKSLTNEKSLSKLQEEYDALVEEINYYTSIIEDQNVALVELGKELAALKEQFGDERRTQFDLAAGGDISEEDLIKDEPLVVSITSDGLIKAVDEREYTTQRRGGKGVKGSVTKEDEVVTDLFSISSKDDLLFMTNTGRCHKLKGYKIPKVAKSAKGKHINNFISLQEDEEIVSVMSLRVADEADSSIIFVTALGQIKRLAVKDLSTKYSVTKVLTIKDGDALATSLKAKENDDILICTAKGQSTRFTISESTKKPIRPQGRTASGVMGIRVADDDYVIGATIISDDINILTLTAKGLSKQTTGSAWEAKGRGGKGMICHKITEKTGDIVSVLAVKEDDELFVGTESGKIIRLAASSIALSGRASIGSKAITLDDGDFAFTASLAPQSIEEEVDTDEE